MLDALWFALAGHVGFPAGESVRNTFVPLAPKGGWTTDAVFLTVAIVGTTIAPWQLFFQQSCVADKRLRFADLTWARLDTFIGACFTVLVSGAMMLVGNAAVAHGFKFDDPSQTALDLFKVSGPFARNALLLLMCNAAVLGTTAVSLAKVDTLNIPPMQLTRTVKFSLLTLRAYLVVMATMLVYHFLDLAGILGHHAK